MRDTVTPEARALDRVLLVVLDAPTPPPSFLAVIPTIW
jgi:hypothetical protein